MNAPRERVRNASILLVTLAGRTREVEDGATLAVAAKMAAFRVRRMLPNPLR